MLRSRGYGRLLAVRFATQWGDGMFQAALGGAVLFNPERQADPLAVAAGLAVLLLPYSLISPFAGALLDRWDRRRVLVLAGLARAVLIVVVAGCVYGGSTGVPLYAGALAVAGVSRFVLSGLSVALPHVVDRRRLVEANVLAVTTGSGLTALGAASAIGVRALVGGGDVGSAEAVLVAVAGSLVASALAVGFRRGSLGPEAGPRAARPVVTVLRGVVDGARAVAATPSIGASLAALGGHRLAFGISTLLSLLLFRYAFTDDGPLRAGLPGIAEAVVLAALGLVLAAGATPVLVRRWGRPATVRAALLAATAVQLALAALLSLWAVFAAAFLLGLTGQVVKLCTDAALQGEADDEVLGRVFAVNDVVFNVGYVVAVAVAALLSPPDGRAPWLLGGAAALYVVGLVVHEAQLRRRSPPPTPPARPRPPHA